MKTRTFLIKIILKRYKIGIIKTIIIKILYFQQQQQHKIKFLSINKS